MIFLVVCLLRQKYRIIFRNTLIINEVISDSGFEIRQQFTYAKRQK